MTGFFLQLMFLALISIASAAKCRSDHDCSFGGTCVAGSCRCRHSCRDKGILILCGEDGKYYMNYCFLMARMCEINTDIRVQQVGYHERCRSHPLSKFVATTERTGLTGCPVSKRYCQNFGVCARGRSGEAVCLCTPDFEGQRCQFRKAPLDDVTYRLQALTLDIPSGNDFSNHKNVLVVILVFCIFSALLSAAVTSAVCHRFRIRQIRRTVTNAGMPLEAPQRKTIPTTPIKLPPSNSPVATTIVLSDA